jgi:hypothetical protein
LPDRYEKVEQQLDSLTALVLYRGPMTSYQACIELQPKGFAKKRATQRFLTPHDPPPSTVQTHFDILEEDGELFVYRRKKTGRRHKYYGFTPYGFLIALGNPNLNARGDFKKILQTWLQQDKFRFFLPKHDVLAKIESNEIVQSLADICLLVAHAFPVAQDVADYLHELGYGEFGAAQIVDFAAQVAESAFPQQFMTASKVLVHNFPTYRDQLRQYVESHQQWLAMIRKELLTEEAE